MDIEEADGMIFYSCFYAITDFCVCREYCPVEYEMLRDLLFYE